MKLILTILCLVFAMSAQAIAQDSPKYNHSAQKKFIPKDLGKVYLGIPLKEFAEIIPVGRAAAEGKFDFLVLKIPMSTKTIQDLTVYVSGIPRKEMQEIIFEESSVGKDENGEEFDKFTERIDLSKIPASAFIYSMSIEFKSEFDLKSFVIKTYGDDGVIRDPDDEYHFYDIEWTKQTPDGLSWLIRSFHEGESRLLQLHGRIKGTEWAVD